MEFIERQYRLKCVTPGDIQEHLPTLARYASECECVVEMGVSKICSTWALLYGLSQSNALKRSMISVDIENIFMGFVSAKAEEVGIDFKFKNENSATVEIEKMDLLFIDTWHVYGHLKRELAKHHTKVTKYIILHDTENDALLGETVRFWCDYSGRGNIGGLKEYVKVHASRLGYTDDEVARGLKPALDEFLNEHPEWYIHEHFTNNNGLTVLKKIETKHR